MKDWELLRDELVAADERIDHYGPFAECMEEPYSSSLRQETEDALADDIEIYLLDYINNGILTNDIVERYSDFFERHGLPTDLQAYRDKKVGEFAVKRYKEENSIVDHVKDYRSDCRKIRKIIGRQLRDARMARAHSIADASALTGIPEGAIARIESGRSNAEIDTIAILATVYNAKITIYG